MLWYLVWRWMVIQERSTSDRQSMGCSWGWHCLHPSWTSLNNKNYKSGWSICIQLYHLKWNCAECIIHACMSIKGINYMWLDKTWVTFFHWRILLILLGVITINVSWKVWQLLLFYIIVIDWTRVKATSSHHTLVSGHLHVSENPCL